MLFVNLGLIALGIAGIAIQLKKVKHLVDFTHLLLLVAIGGVIATKCDANGITLIYTIVTVTAVNFVLSKVSLFRKKYVRLAPPVISLLIIALLLKDLNVTYESGDFQVFNKFSIGAFLVSILAVDLAKLKFIATKSLLGISDEERFLKAALLIFVGIIGFLGSFQSGALGLYMASAFYFSASFYRERKESYAGTSMLIFSIISYIAGLGEGYSLLLKGELVFGLLLGASGAMLIHAQLKEKTTSILNLFVSHSIILMLGIGLILLHKVQANMGGTDALTGVLAGIGIVIIVVGNELVGLSLFPLLIAGAIIASPLLINKKQEAFESMFDEFSDVDMGTADTVVTDTLSQVEKDTVALDVNPTNDTEQKEVAVQEKPGLFAEFVGDYKFVPENSKVLFELGEEGETKGAFTTLTGSAKVSNDPAEWKLNVQMKMSNFTTFDDMRDEHLMGEEYFNVEQFPSMTFNVTKASKNGNQWTLSGTFTMLGVSKQQSVTVQPLKKDGKKYLMGKGSIDRRLYGMTPSSTEGNIVSFNYIVEIK